MIRRRARAEGFGAARRVFFCIGAQKAGTTWLYQTLKRHPEIHLSRIKEVHYWDSVFPPHLPFYVAKAERAVREHEGAPAPLQLLRRALPGPAARLADARRYHAMFAEADPTHRSYQNYLTAGASGHPVVGDISPGYAMMGREAFAAMDAASPDARFVFIMRDPVARLWSNVRHNRARRFPRDSAAPDVAAAFRDRLARTEGGPFRRSDYRRTILELEAAVPRERIAYFFYESLFDRSEIARLMEFVGVSPTPADLELRVNAGTGPDAGPDPASAALARERLAPVYAFAAERFGSALPDAWRAGAA